MTGPEGQAAEEAEAQAIVVLVTGPDVETLTRLGRTLVEERLAACINVLDGVTSIYRWNDEVQADPEALGILKTTSARLPQLTARIEALHPYDTPEVIGLPVVGGSGAYLDWVASSVGDD